MANFISKFIAKRRIPKKKAYNLISEINLRYSNLNFDNQNFKGLNRKEKLSKLLNMINNDQQISELNSLSIIGSILESFAGEKTTIGGFGKNLCIGENGVFIYSWNDYDGKYNDIKATLESLEENMPNVNAEVLRRAIIDYADKENYINRVVDFNKFKAVN